MPEPINISNLSLQQGDFILSIENLIIANGLTVIVGANGSGKSSFLESLLGMRQKVKIQGLMLQQQLPITNKNIKNNLGVALQNIPFLNDLTVQDIVNLHKNIYPQSYTDIYQLWDIEQIMSIKCAQLSTGQKQRLYMFMAMAHKPQLLILDEPSTGLDKNYQQKLLDWLKKHKSTHTIIVASHNYQEMQLSNSVIWLKQGKLYQQDSVANLIDCYIGDVLLTIETDECNIESITTYLESYTQVVIKNKILNKNKIIIYGNKQLMLALDNMDKTKCDAYAAKLTNSEDLLNLIAMEVK